MKLPDLANTRLVQKPSNHPDLASERSADARSWFQASRVRVASLVLPAGAEADKRRMKQARRGVQEAFLAVLELEGKK